MVDDLLLFQTKVAQVMKLVIFCTISLDFTEYLVSIVIAVINSSHMSITRF